MAHDTHSIQRTSAKGGPFVGTCTKCGKPGLTLADLKEACANPGGTSQNDALLHALGRGQ